MNQFGNYFRLSSYGESHGVAVGIIIDGVPSGIELVEDDFLKISILSQINKISFL